MDLMPNNDLLNFDSSLPVLIIDAKGIIGDSLAQVLKSFTQVVLVTKAKIAQSPNLIIINFSTHIENIPSDRYSTIFFIPENQSDLIDYLPSFLEKAKEDDSKLILILPIYLLSVVKEFNLPQEPTLKIVLTDEVFGNFHLESEINKFLISVKEKKEINLHNMGLKTLRPIFYEDLIDKILETASNKQGGYFAAFQKGEIAELSIAHALQKIDPSIKIDFSKEEVKIKDRSFEENGYYLLDSSYPIFEKIQNLYKKISTKNIKIAHSEKKTAEFFKDKILETKSGIGPVSFLTTFILTFIFLPLIVSALSLSSAFLLGRLSISSLAKKNFKNAQNLANLALSSSSLSRSSSNFFLDEVKTLGLYDHFYFISEYETSFNNVFLILKNLSNQENFKINNSLISNAFVFQAEAQKILTLNYLPSQIETNINNFYQNYSNIFNVLEALPQITGENGPRTYLVLFQNNAELRPGGGFIGSYALVNFKDGQMTNFKVYDVYDADGQLKGHIEPPFPIRRYLPSVHFYLRDSNFDPDFTVDAYEAAFILKQETGVNVDGVFAINESAIENLLSATGSIYLNDYNKNITASNFFITAENASEKNFFPGSRQKGNFLKSFFDSLIQKIQTGGINYEKLIENILNSINSKNILFAFSDNNIQSLFAANHLSSALPGVGLEKSNSINDFLGLSEANLGVNKADYFVKRNVEEELTIGDNASVSATVTVNFVNNSSSWPGGDYKNYLRFILPKDTILTGVSINGVDQKIVPAVTDSAIYEKKSFIPPSGLEVFQQYESDKNIYGFLVIVPKMQSSKITISYVLNQKVDLTASVLNYGLYYYKQSGTGIYPFTLKINFPTNYSTLSLPTASKFTGHQVILNQQIYQDQKYNFSFRKN